MDRTIQKICGLLQSPDNMRRCAAAISLAELAPKDADAVKALGEALPTANAMLTTYVLEAFEAIGSPAAAAYVLPLLDAEEMQTRLRAATIISKAGAGVVPEITGRLEKATRPQKPVLVDVLGRIHTREAFQAILDLLFDPDFELVRHACDTVRRHIADVAPKDRAGLHKQVVGFMKTPRVQSQERVLTSCLLLLGSIGRPEARAILLKHSTPKIPIYLRRHALIGLKNLELTGAAATATLRQILPYLNDPDEGVVRHVLEILERLPAGVSSAAQWLKLLKSPHATVRGFAARKVGGVDDAAHNRELLRLLGHEDTEIREIAASALSAHKDATRLLLDAFSREADVEAAWRMAKILKPHSEGVDARTVKRLAAVAAQDMKAGNPRYEALLYFLNNVGPKNAYAVVREAGLEHKRAKRWAPAVECLRRLINTESFDDETRYALSVCNLKLSPKDLDPRSRAEDHALRGFQVLLRNPAFKLLDRLQKDKALDAADLYYAGFHFSEAAGEESQAGEQLLRHVAKTWARSEAGKAAKNKLKLTKPG